MAQPNQFTKAKEQGLPMPYRKPHKLDEQTKDKIRAEILSRRVYRYANAKGHALDKYRMEPAQVQAAKVLIDKGKPSLQSIEAHDVDPLAAMSESEMVEVIRAHIHAHPEVMRALNLIPDPSVVPQSADTPLATGTEGPLQP